ncbi:MAG TPA: hypothetical protein VGT41_01065 [Candidatus Babeliales bacterium]|nr:hypothetical protein [Candidatus Babeliales bacterium]
MIISNLHKGIGLVIAGTLLLLHALEVLPAGKGYIIGFAIAVIIDGICHIGKYIIKQRKQ